MSNLRRQVDRIDQKLLTLLQQRTDLSGRIGSIKREHGARIYVPDRERELLARVANLSEGKLPVPAVGAIFREILSSSRAAQGQPPIGLLRNGAAAIIPAARCHFGACDEFSETASWPELKRRLVGGKLALALLRVTDLASAVQYSGPLFPETIQVVGEMDTSHPPRGMATRIFIATAATPNATGQRALILIECKATVNAVKSNLRAMSSRLLHQVEVYGLSGGKSLAALRFRQPLSGDDLQFVPDAKVHRLGLYAVSETYGG